MLWSHQPFPRRPSKKPDSLLPLASSLCHISSDGDKIIGGVELAPNAIPYIVSLQYSDDDFHFCGGSIYDHVKTSQTIILFYSQTALLISQQSEVFTTTFPDIYVDHHIDSI